MMAREMSSPRARGMSDRLLTAGAAESASTPQQGGQTQKPDGVSKSMPPLDSLDIGPSSGMAAAQPRNMGLGVGVAAPSAEARLMAATQLRKLNRISQSNSIEGLSSVAKSGRAPSPDLLQSVPRESLLPEDESTMHHVPASAGASDIDSDPELEIVAEDDIDEELGCGPARP
jgi:hypothetical protein